MRNVIVWWVTCLIWSSVWLFIKMGVEELPPVSFAGIRLIVALTVLVPLLAVRGTPIPHVARDRILIATTGVMLLGVNYACTYWSAQYVSSGLTAVLQAATPAFALCFGHYLLPDERFSLRNVAALALGIGGVAVICADRMHVTGGIGLMGALAVAAGGVSVALGYVMVKARGSHLEPTVIMAGQMISAAIPLMVFGLLHGNPFHFHWTPRSVVALLYLALAGSVAGFWLNYWLLKRMGATTVLSMALVEPLIAVALGAIVLGETVTVTAVLGGICILVSVSLLITKRTLTDEGRRSERLNADAAL
jgi:drug/metabolite transporter (DMT)-like permease